MTACDYTLIGEEFLTASAILSDKPDLKKYLSRRQRVSLGEEGSYAYLATREALKNAQIKEKFFDQNDVGIIYGNDSTAKSTIESVDKIREKKNTTLVGSGAIFKAMNSTITMNLSTIYKLKGINFTLSAACASGSHAIGIAYQFIKSGLQDCVICGGAQEINELSMGSFDCCSGDLPLTRFALFTQREKL